VLFGVAAVVQASAVRGLTAPTGTLGGFVAAALRSPLLLLVVAMYLGGFLLHAVAIWLLPLYLAQASISLSLPVTVLVSRRLAERLAWTHWAGVGAITVGLALVAVGAGEAGAARSDAGFAAGAVCAVAVLVVLARSGRVSGAAALGLLSGLGYAGSAIAVRGVDLPLDPAVVVTALTVPAFGLVAFWLYSLGLARGDVRVSTAPLVTAQTGVPALVGVLLLGDQVRPGWGALVVVGLVLAIAGTVLLSGEQLTADQSSVPGP
jgi:drug/metabolite transporter (DMT)-like permease